jgi:hypothetical protein
VYFRLDTGLVLNQQLFDTHYKASVGKTDYVEVSVKYEKGAGNPNGNVKVKVSLFMTMRW